MLSLNLLQVLFSLLWPKKCKKIQKLYSNSLAAWTEETWTQSEFQVIWLYTVVQMKGFGYIYSPIWIGARCVNIVACITLIWNWIEIVFQFSVVYWYVKGLISSCLRTHRKYPLPSFTLKLGFTKSQSKPSWFKKKMAKIPWTDRCLGLGLKMYNNP